MNLVRCGWCAATAPVGQCPVCGRDTLTAWRQRGVQAPVVASGEGRPPLDATAVHRLYTATRDALVGEGKTPTVDAIAERLDRSPRTVREWKQRFGLR